MKSRPADAYSLNFRVTAGPPQLGFFAFRGALRQGEKRFGLPDGTVRFPGIWSTGPDLFSGSSAQKQKAGKHHHQSTQRVLALGCNSGRHRESREGKCPTPSGQLLAQDHRLEGRHVGLRSKHFGGPSFRLRIFGAASAAGKLTHFAVWFLTHPARENIDPERLRVTNRR